RTGTCEEVLALILALVPLHRKGEERERPAQVLRSLTLRSWLATRSALPACLAERLLNIRARAQAVELWIFTEPLSVARTLEILSGMGPGQEFNSRSSVFFSELVSAIGRLLDIVPSGCRGQCISTCQRVKSVGRD